MRERFTSCGRSKYVKYYNLDYLATIHNLKAKFKQSLLTAPCLQYRCRVDINQYTKQRQQKWHNI